MIDQTLLTITFIGIMLLVGLLSSILSRKLKIPNLILLIGIGMLSNFVKYNGKPLLEFPPIFLTALAIITLAMIVFDSSSRFRFRELDSLSSSALKLSIIFLVLNMALLSVVLFYLFNLDSFLYALLFGAVVSGTDPSSTLMILSGARFRLFEFLKIESILNTPLIVLIPFLIIDLMNTAGKNITWSILSLQALPFIQQFVIGIGVGILIALIFFRFMKKNYSETLSPLAMIIVSLLSYSLSEVLGGNGVLAVTTAGFMFGNLYHIRHMKKLQKFGEVFSEVFEILVFILIGASIRIQWTSVRFMLPATLLFIIYLAIRLLSVQLAFFRSTYSLKEKLYMTLNIPKGIAVAVVVFTLITRQIQGINIIADLILLFLIYSIVLSTIITHFTKFFTKFAIKVDETQ